MTTTTITHSHASAASGANVISRLLHSFTRSMIRRRTHAALANLDDRMLRDIGLSRAEVERMSHRH